MVHQIYRLEFSQLDSPRVHRFHEYWKARRTAEHAVPLRAHVDPTELRELLPNIVIIEVEQAPLRFRYRLVGTRVVEFNKLDFTGLYLGSIGWDEEQQIVDTCVDVVSSRQPLCGFYSWTLQTGAIGRCEFGIFPFSADGENGDADLRHRRLRIPARVHRRAFARAGVATVAIARRRPPASSRCGPAAR